MKCRVCRATASVEVRRHNAAFCKAHFLQHVERAVAKAIRKFAMFTHDDRLLLGVSGGKDSLALWEILTSLGYTVEGVYLDLGIPGYSGASGALARDFASARGLHLDVRAVAGVAGFTIPEAAAASGRVPCSACGLSKRYLLNQAALDGGYDVLVMGHNLDDEAATLFANVLTWDIEPLGRQAAVLPARPGLVRKAKPLVRVAERETAAYCVLAGIRYEVDECPLAAGNTSFAHKAVLDRLEAQHPGAKHRLVFGYLDRAAPLFAPHSGHSAVHACATCGQPTTGEVCAFCRLRSRVAASRLADQPGP